MEKKPRLRAPNFTPSENLLLCEIVDKYKHILENKKTDGATLLQKKKAWLVVRNEFNSSTSGCFRTAEGLHQNYKNLKKKAKKDASNEKMDIPAIPVDSALEVNIEEYGTSSQSCDWTEVAKNTGASETTCKEMFEALAKEAETRGRILKRAIMGTGGGPPPTDDKDPVLEKVKALMAPVMDGNYTTCDGDSSLMASQDEIPIEFQNIESGSPKLDMQGTQDDFDNPDSEIYFSHNRANLKKRPHYQLSRKRKSETQKSIMELLELQKELFKTQIREQQNQSEHKSALRAMEIEEAKKKYKHNEEIREMEIEEMRRRNIFNEKMRQS